MEADLIFQPAFEHFSILASPLFSLMPFGLKWLNSAKSTFARISGFVAGGGPLEDSAERPGRHALTHPWKLGRTAQGDSEFFRPCGPAADPVACQP